MSASRAPKGTGLPKGLPGGGRVRVVPLGKTLFAFVSDVPLSRYGEEGLSAILGDLDAVGRCAAAHASVIEAVHARGAASLVPAKLFTLFFDDARLAAWAARSRAPVARSLRRVADADEWSVRVTLDERAALRVRAKEAASATRAGAGRARAGAGAAFLARKRATRDVARKVALDAHERAAEAHEALARLSRDSVIQPAIAGPAGTRMLLDAAYLVPRARVARFRAAVAAVRKRLGPGLSLLVQGPWPPWHFAGAR